MTPNSPDDFRGAAKPMSEGAITATARALSCEEATIRAIITVESRGGFDREGRPRILFERHYFHRLTQGRFTAGHPDISKARPGGYGAAGVQYDRLARATALDRGAALRSASWGAFQIMGANHAAAGFADIESFVAAMMEGEDRHLAAFAAFVRDAGLVSALRARDWAGFARGYNGPAFRRHRYDDRLADAYRRHAGGAVLPLRRGTRGEAVRRLQTRLGLAADGRFGALTEAAVRGAQSALGLAVDGIAGPDTQSALALASSVRSG